MSPTVTPWVIRVSQKRTCERLQGMKIRNEEPMCVFRMAVNKDGESDGKRRGVGKAAGLWGAPAEKVEEGGRRRMPSPGSGRRS